MFEEVSAIHFFLIKIENKLYKCLLHTYALAFPNELFDNFNYFQYTGHTLNKREPILRSPCPISGVLRIPIP